MPRPSTCLITPLLLIMVGIIASLTTPSMVLAQAEPPAISSCSTMVVDDGKIFLNNVPNIEVGATNLQSVSKGTVRVVSVLDAKKNTKAYLDRIVAQCAEWRDPISGGPKNDLLAIIIGNKDGAMDVWPGPGWASRISNTRAKQIAGKMESEVGRQVTDARKRTGFNPQTYNPDWMRVTNVALTDLVSLTRNSQAAAPRQQPSSGVAQPVPTTTSTEKTEKSDLGWLGKLLLVIFLIAIAGAIVVAALLAVIRLFKQGDSSKLAQLAATKARNRVNDLIIGKGQRIGFETRGKQSFARLEKLQDDGLISSAVFAVYGPRITRAYGLFEEFNNLKDTANTNEKGQSIAIYEDYTDQWNKLADQIEAAIVDLDLIDREMDTPEKMTASLNVPSQPRALETGTPVVNVRPARAVPPAWSLDDLPSERSAPAPRRVERREPPRSPSIGRPSYESEIGLAHQSYQEAYNAVNEPFEWQYITRETLSLVAQAWHQIQQAEHHRASNRFELAGVARRTAETALSNAQTDIRRQVDQSNRQDFRPYRPNWRDDPYYHDRPTGGYVYGIAVPDAVHPSAEPTRRTRSAPVVPEVPEDIPVRDANWRRATEDVSTPGGNWRAAVEQPVENRDSGDEGSTSGLLPGQVEVEQQQLSTPVESPSPATPSSDEGSGANWRGAVS